MPYLALTSLLNLHSEKYSHQEILAPTLHPILLPAHLPVDIQAIQKAAHTHFPSWHQEDGQHRSQRFGQL